MASFKYLWQNRSRPSLFTFNYFKVWGKRILTLKEVLKRNNRRRKLLRKGAQIAGSVEIGPSVINGSKTNLKIGKNTFVGRVHIALHETVTIGENVCINDGVKILTASHDLNDPNWNEVKKPIVIKDYAWIATDAIILPGVTIGYGAVIGAGSVISRNIGDYQIAVGNPCRILDKQRIEKLKYNPCEFLAGNRAWLLD